MGLLNKILGRPSHDKPFVLLVAGHPAKNSLVPTSCANRWVKSARLWQSILSALHPRLNPVNLVDLWFWNDCLCFLRTGR